MITSPIDVNTQPFTTNAITLKFISFHFKFQIPFCLLIFVFFILHI